MTQRVDRKSSTSPHSRGCHSRPRLKHSRAGYSGNPFGVRSLRRRLNLKAGFSAYPQWIPAFAGMTIGIHQPAPPTGMPVKAIFMRLPGHALPRGKRFLAMQKNVGWIKRCGSTQYLVILNPSLRSKVNYVKDLRLQRRWVKLLCAGCTLYIVSPNSAKQILHAVQDDKALGGSVALDPHYIFLHC